VTPKAAVGVAGVVLGARPSCAEGAVTANGRGRAMRRRRGCVPLAPRAATSN